MNGIYKDIAERTGGDIYIGIVGPVRTGKSTFIKRFMETLVLPNIDNVYRKERARDELPQSGSGRTIMTAEPKFIPEDAVSITMEDGAEFQVRLIDCVGYMIEGAVGHLEGETQRMVSTPWFPQAIPMAEAAEIGTRKVITEHSTIGIVLTTDGSVTEIPREDYVEAEERVISELKAMNKPFLLVINSAQPQSPMAKALQEELSQRYQVSTLLCNCLELQEEDIATLVKQVLYEFPIKELCLQLPAWVNALDPEHPIKETLYNAIREGAMSLKRIADVGATVDAIGQCEEISEARVLSMNLGTGEAMALLELPRALFYHTISHQSGFQIADDGDLMALLRQLSHVKASYDKVATALEEVEETGYGIVVPSIEALVLEEPEIVKQGGRYGVRLKASAPSIHMIRADIETEVSPIVGTEKQSEEMIHYLLQEFEGDSSKIWQSNIFGKSFHELVGEDLNTKVKRMPEEAREKLRDTLQRIINEGSGGLICIIL